MDLSTYQHYSTYHQTKEPAWPQHYIDNHHMQAIQDAERGTWDVQSIAT